MRKIFHLSESDDNVGNTDQSEIIITNKVNTEKADFDEERTVDKIWREKSNAYIIS